MLARINFDLGKNGCHRYSGLGNRLTVVVKQYDKILADYIFLVFDNFNSGARLGCLNRFSVNNFIPNTFMA